MRPTSAEFESQYAALNGAAGLADLSTRTQLELTGHDRAAFLHNFTTNAVRDLAVGSGCEAFVLNSKGHTIGHVFIFACPDSHVIETSPGQAETLTAHFDRYIIREDVQLHDRSNEWAELLLAGREAETLLTNLGLSAPGQRLAHTAGQIAAIPVWIRRVDFTGPIGFLIAFRQEALIEIEAALVTAGAARCGADAVEAARIEQGTPWFGVDITPENLPQEVGQTSSAVSFTKGCYLGQETVARIDALGHVNRLLCGVKLYGEVVPEPRLELHSAGKTVGHVTSACWSPGLKAPLALAYIRRGSHEPGTKLQSAIGDAEIVALPIAK